MKKGKGGKGYFCTCLCDLSASPSLRAAAHTGNPVISVKQHGTKPKIMPTNPPAVANKTQSTFNSGQIQVEEELFLCKGSLFFHFTCFFVALSSCS